MVKKAVRKRKVKKADGPKKPKSGFMFYAKERRVTLKTEQPSLSMVDASKVMSAEWNTLSDEDKKRYQDMAEADRKRFSDEKEAKASS